MEATNQNTDTVTAESKSAVIVCGRFNGMLHSFQMNAYNTLIACAITKPVAHKVATDFGSDVGRMMKSDSDLSSKVAKANKDGESKLTIKGGGKIKMTDAMRLVRLAQQTHDLYKEGLLKNRDLPAMHDNLELYVAECETWVGQNVFA